MSENQNAPVVVMATTGAWTLPETAKCSGSGCKKVGTRRIDPYYSDVYNRKILRYLCDEHEQSAADDI